MMGPYSPLLGVGHCAHGRVLYYYFDSHVVYYRCCLFCVLDYDYVFELMWVFYLAHSAVIFDYVGCI